MSKGLLAFATWFAAAFAVKTYAPQSWFDGSSAFYITVFFAVWLIATIFAAGWQMRRSKC